jgi:nitroreductase
VKTYDAIMTRRSIGRTSEQVPSRAQVERLLDAAVRAPTHHLSQPWRFVILAGDARHGLAEAWGQGLAATGGDPSKVLDKPLRAPVIVSVIATPKHHLPKVVEVEEHHAVGAALQNMLLAAHDMGLAAMIRTGNAGSLTQVRDFLGLSDKESVAGFVYVGYPADGESERPPVRRDAASNRTEWRGDL